MTLTAEQTLGIQNGQAVSVTVDQTECVVVRKDVFQKIRQLAYDDSEWSDEEMEAAAAGMFDALDDAEKIRRSAATSSCADSRTLVQVE